jgi:hypothetical protein
MTVAGSAAEAETVGDTVSLSGGLRRLFDKDSEEGATLTIWAELNLDCHRGLWLCLL